jgi:hypothetical protein
LDYSLTRLYNGGSLSLHGNHFEAERYYCIEFLPSPGRGRGRKVERGAAPLLNTPLEGRSIKGGSKGGETSLPKTSFLKGRTKEVR